MQADWRIMKNVKGTNLEYLLKVFLQNRHWTWILANAVE